MRIIPSVLTAGACVGVGYLFRQHMGEWSVAPYWPWCYVAAGVVLVVMVLDKVRWTARMLATTGGLAGTVLGSWFCSGDVPAATPKVWLGPWLLAAGVLLLLAVVASRFRFATSERIRTWWQHRGRPSGFATRGQMFRVASGWAMRRRAKVMRPSLGEASWLRRWFATPTREFATALARVGWLRVHSPIEDVTLRVGGPRSGKTGELAGRILDAPGAVITTSTRTDLVSLTSELRAGRGPVRVFNPSGLGGLETTIGFDPVAGCQTPKTAVHRAEDLLSGSGAPGHGGDMEFWAAQARRVLAALLHAAALSDGSMFTVLGWVSGPEAAETKKAITNGLRRSPEPAFEKDAAQFLGTNPRTQSSITATIMPALGWLTDSTAVAATMGGGFDVAELLETATTVYLLGAEDGQTAPLVSALTGHIAREARRIAAHQPDGRLDPPLTLALDEAALICPIPLDRWSADMGGRGVTIHAAIQGRSQLKQRWGDDGAATIMTNTGTLLVYGRSKDADDLRYYSELTGTRWKYAPAEPGERPVAHEFPTMSPAEIAQLQPGHVLIIRSGMPAAKGKVRMAWKRLDVRAHHATKRLAVLAQRFAHLGRRTATVSRTAGQAMARGTNRTVQATKPAADAGLNRWRTMRDSRGSANTPASIRRIHGNRQHNHNQTDRTAIEHEQIEADSVYGTDHEGEQ